MESIRKLAELEKLVQKLNQKLAALERSDADKTRTIRSLKVKVLELESNVAYLSRRK